MIKAVELRRGKAVVHEDTIYVVHDVNHVAKGNKRSYMQARLKNLKTGGIINVRFSVNDRLEVPFIESKDYEFLYQDGDGYVLMDSTTFDQITVEGNLFGEAIQYLKPNEKVTGTICEGQLVGVELPFVVELEISDTPPVVTGATATNQPKEAITETGAKIRVPAVIAPGDRVRVDTRTGDYVDRAK